MNNDDPWKRMFMPQGLQGPMSANQAKAGLLAGPQQAQGLQPGPQAPQGLQGISPMQIYNSLYGPGPRQRMGGHSGGIIEPGNIDVFNRPQVKNADGSVSTVRSMSFRTDKGEVLVPTVSEDGRIMSNDEAIEQYFRTGRHLGIFSTPEEATRYSLSLHDQQDRYYTQGKK